MAAARKGCVIGDEPDGDEPDDNRVLDDATGGVVGEGRDEGTRKLYHDRYAPLKLRRAKLSEHCVQMTLRACRHPTNRVRQQAGLSEDCGKNEASHRTLTQARLLPRAVGTALHNL